MSIEDKLCHTLFLLSEKEKYKGERMFMGKPDRWYEKPTFRCINNHVSNMILKSEVNGDCCLACGSICFLTFPEDRDGILDEDIDTHIILGYN